MKENIIKSKLSNVCGGVLRPTEDLSSEFQGIDTDTLKQRARDLFELKQYNINFLKVYKTMLKEGFITEENYKSLENTAQQVVNLSYSADLELSRRQPTITLRFPKMKGCK